MEHKIVSDEKECKRLWNKFSPNKTLWDIWEVMQCLREDGLYKFHFIVILDHGKEKGLVPLWIDKKLDKAFFVGDINTENISFWADPALFEDIVKIIPKPALFYDLNHEFVNEVIKSNARCKKYFKQDDFRYYIDLEKHKGDANNFLKTFSKKHRKNLLYDLRQLEKLDYKIIWEKMQHYDDFVKLSQKKFGKESDFSKKDTIEQMRIFLNYLAKKDMLYVSTIIIDRKIAAVGLGAFYNGIYYLINESFDPEIRNLGKLINMTHIRKAAELKAKQIDFMSSDTGWKELWKLDKDPYYTVRL